MTKLNVLFKMEYISSLNCDVLKKSYVPYLRLPFKSARELTKTTRLHRYVSKNLIKPATCRKNNLLTTQPLIRPNPFAS